jgi:beta-N-acetylhexosaminidase
MMAPMAAPTERRPVRVAGDRVLRTFEGTEPTAEILAAIAAGRAAGVSLYRAWNIASPAQVRDLVATLQGARPTGEPPLIVALDQEGGQLEAIGDGATAWPGNLALAATGSADLAEAAGRAIGDELAALGVNVDFAPVCDLLSDPHSSVMGTRTFGDEPVLAGRLVAAMVRGLQATGVAATIKHFPGHGSVSGDPHHGLPVSAVDGATLRTRELVPFGAGIGAGAELAMLGHLAVPAETDGRASPATLAPELARTLLRGELGFEGVSISDALDMGALGDLGALPELAVAVAAAGIDLLLAKHPYPLEEAAVDAVEAAATDGRLDPIDAAAAAGRVRALRGGFAGGPTRSLDVVGCAKHRALARTIAERSITLLRDRDGVLPLRPGAAGRIGGDRVAVVAPRPTDLTPADTSSYVRLRLADRLREGGLDVDEVEIPLDPGPGDIDAVRARLRGIGVAIVGTVDALGHPSQAGLIDALLADGIATIAVALRTPFDLAAYPGAATAIATYGIQPPSLEAAADAILGRIAFAGSLPVRLVVPSTGVSA